jgi:hypothetical protein
MEMKNKADTYHPKLMTAVTLGQESGGLYCKWHT